MLWQTGSGKTHTMMGISTDPNTRSRPSDRRGLIPRVIERLFSRMQEVGVDYALCRPLP